MKYLLTTITFALLAGCTDAERASMFALGDKATVTCYSGGDIIFRDISTGKIAQLDGDGITFKSSSTGQYVRAFADCIVVAGGE